jgi:hypothetical protein
MYRASFKITTTDDEVWSLSLDDLELVAGLVAGTMSLLQYLREPNYYISTEADISKFRLVDSVDIDDIELYSRAMLFCDQYLTMPPGTLNTDVSTFLQHMVQTTVPIGTGQISSENRSPEIDILRVLSTNNKLYSLAELLRNQCSNDFMYMVWMPSGTEGRYSLYGFKTSKFFQGIFSMCDRFNVDYRDCIYGIPFDRSGKKYTFDGYNLVIYQVAQDAPDLEDVEKEEEDDENVYAPYSVSDGDDENQFD